MKGAFGKQLAWRYRNNFSLRAESFSFVSKLFFVVPQSNLVRRRHQGREKLCTENAGGNLINRARADEEP